MSGLVSDLGPGVTLNVARSSEPGNEQNSARVLRLLSLAHLGFGIVCALGFLGVVLRGGSVMPFIVRVVLTILLGVAAAAHLTAAVQVPKRSWMGRFLSTFITYLTAVFLIIALTHLLGVFSSLNAFSDGFHDGFWWLALVGVGTIWFFVARGKGRVSWAKVVERAGLGLGAIGILGFFITQRGWHPFWVALTRLVKPWPLLCAVALTICLLMMRHVFGTRADRLFGTTPKQNDTIAGWLYLSPNLIGFTLFFAGPLVFSLVISFFNWDFLGAKTFAGLKNYGSLFTLGYHSMPSAGAALDGVIPNGQSLLMHIDWFGWHAILTAKDVVFWLAIKNILLFLVLAVPLSVGPALVIAQLLQSKLRFTKVFRAIYFIPSVAGVVSITLIWKLLLDASVGFLNYFLTRFNGLLDALPFIERSSKPVQIQWLSSQWTAMFSLVFVFAWMTFGFNTVLFSAGLQSVPAEVQEAASIDGAGAWKRFRLITLPLLRPTTFYVLVTTSVMALQLFDIVWVLTPAPGGGPDNATTTPVLYLYRTSFQESRPGYASAVAWVLFLLIFTFTFIQFRAEQRNAV
jgi:ABC-type sugar transport system permease subunit